mmetsp:Transcript_142231/g.247975  ORF Transcript_142231/g.247975 Transcript_142231/m.247975 type:complete len:741 (-) Transcript_142231:93-2315(-)
MSRLFSFACLIAAAAGTVEHQGLQERGLVGQKQQTALLQTWGKTLNSAVATPIARVVNLLKEMSATLTKEMSDDEALHEQLMCWCNDGDYEKTQEIEAAESKIAELESSISADTAKSSELSTTIKSLEEDIAANKKALAEATEIRKKQAAEFAKSEKDDIEALENLKAAIEVLSRHHSSAFPQLALSLLANGHKDMPWGSEHESRAERNFDDFVQKFGLHGDVPRAVAPHHFLQQEEAKPTVAPAAQSQDWSAREMVVVKRGLQTASAFVQRLHGYMPSYTAQSGEIMGVLKELQEEMKSALSDAQKAEAAEAASFAELSKAKASEIENTEKMAERKEDELATTNIALANAKEELTQVEASLSEDQKFLLNLKETCKDATSNFEERKSTRLAEIQAVADAIGILTADEAKDTFKDTYSFVQVFAKRREESQLRRQAANVLRHAAAKGRNPELSIMATSVELDAFTKVKEAIDKMVAQLKLQQKDEVTTSDYCKAEIQKNEMDTAKATSEKEVQEQKIESLVSTIDAISADIAKNKADIASLQLDLQRATEDRVKESMEFQKTVADQRATVGILKQAMERLAEFYDKQDFMQVGSHGRQAQKQTPPVVQKEYSANKGSAGVMQMMEKLIYEARELEKEATKAEQEAQDAYESLTVTTNGSVAALMKEVATSTANLADTKQEKVTVEGDLKDTNGEIAGLAEYNASLHGDCDYLLKNFDARQTARQQEIEALLEAKAILSGA